MNVKKVLEFLRTHEKFNSRHLFDVNEIVNKDKIIIFELLTDIHNFYCKYYVRISKSRTPDTRKNRSFVQEENLETKMILKNSLLKETSRKLDNSITNNSALNITNEILSNSFSGYYKANHKENCNKVNKTTIYPKKKRTNKTKEIYENKNNSSIFFTFDTSNVQNLEKSILNISRTRNQGKERLDNLKYMSSSMSKSSYYQSVETPQVNFMKMEEINASCLSNKISRDMEINIIKEWLHSLGIKNAYKIKFDKQQIKEFKDG